MEIDQPKLKTWRDLERLSLSDPFVRQMFALIKCGLSREEALIATVCALSDIRQQLLDAEVSRREREPFQLPFLLSFQRTLVQLLASSRRAHYHCDDSWYCCGLCDCVDHGLASGEFLASHDGEAARVSGQCNCGAQAWNEKVDAVLHRWEDGRVDARFSEEI